MAGVQPETDGRRIRAEIEFARQTIKRLNERLDELEEEARVRRLEIERDVRVRRDRPT